MRGWFSYTAAVNNSVAFDALMTAMNNGVTTGSITVTGVKPVGLSATKISAGIWDVTFPCGAKVRLSHSDIVEHGEGYGPWNTCGMVDYNGAASVVVEFAVSSRVLMTRLSNAGGQYWENIAMVEDPGPYTDGVSQSRVFVTQFFTGAEVPKNHKCYGVAGSVDPTVGTHIRGRYETTWFSTNGYYDNQLSALRKHANTFYFIRPDGMTFHGNNAILVWPGAAAPDDHIIAGAETWRAGIIGHGGVRSLFLKDE